MAKKEFEVRDLCGLIKDIPLDNQIISAMDIFNTTILSNTFKFEYDKVRTVKQTAFTPVPRYGEQMSTITADERETGTGDMAFTAASSAIFPADWQGIRVPGKDSEENLESVTARRVIQLGEGLRQTHEEARQLALFENKIILTKGKELNVCELLGAQQTTSEVDLAQDILKQLQDLVALSKVKQRGVVRALRGFTLFCRAELFAAIQTDELLRKVLLFGNQNITDKGLMFPEDILPGFPTFRIPGLALRVVQMDSLPENTAYLVPQFQPYALGDMGVYTQFFGPCARNLKLANGAARDAFMYLEESRGKREIFIESSYAFMNMMPEVVVKVSVKNAAAALAKAKAK
ncbi:major capsid protein [Escherichia coli]|nr:major capsid protein [Escherichia coli]EKH6160901.1 major capsid protein [Escherichia coli O157]ELB3843475.1 major capsid protein [Escherichia coli]ELV5611359.1 major capsid protein [Escherichia coli]